jgi:hypothetical protein
MRELLAALHPADFRYLVALKPGAPPITAQYPVEDFSAVSAFVARHATMRNIYTGVAARDGRGRDAGHCTDLHALFADIDFKDSCEADARQRLSAFPLAPSAIVNSGGGLQVYWLLERPMNLRISHEFSTTLLRSLARVLAADMAAAEPARILRIPGTTNHKYPRPVVLERLTGDRYPASALASLLPAVREAQERDRTPVQHNLSRERRILLAREWVSQQPPAIEGHGGDRHTFTVCCGVVHDHDLDEQTAYSLLREWNARCEPPWTERDLRYKIRGAARGAKGRRGSKLLRERLVFGGYSPRVLRRLGLR